MNGIGMLVQEQAQVFLISFVAGVCLFWLYDLLRIVRRVFLHELIAIAVEDICYWIIWTWSVFYLWNQVNNGMVRGFTLLAVGMGMLLYYILLSKWFILIGVWILKRVLHILSVLWFFLSWPLRQMAKLFRPSSRYIKNKAAKSTHFMKKQLQNSLHTIKMGLCKL